MTYGRDRSKLVKKTITDKRGKTRTVWVRPDEGLEDPGHKHPLFATLFNFLASKKHSVTQKTLHGLFPRFDVMAFMDKRLAARALLDHMYSQFFNKESKKEAKVPRKPSEGPKRISVSVGQKKKASNRALMRDLIAALVTIADLDEKDKAKFRDLYRVFLDPNKAAKKSLPSDGAKESPKLENQKRPMGIPAPLSDDELAYRSKKEEEAKKKRREEYKKVAIDNVRKVLTTSMPAPDEASAKSAYDYMDKNTKSTFEEYQKIIGEEHPLKADIERAKAYYQHLADTYAEERAPEPPLTVAISRYESVLDGIDIALKDKDLGKADELINSAKKTFAGHYNQNPRDPSMKSLRRRLINAEKDINKAKEKVKKEASSHEWSSKRFLSKIRVGAVTKEVQAEGPARGNLGIDLDASGKYTVVHIPSGLGISHDYSSAEAAKSFVDRIARTDPAFLSVDTVDEMTRLNVKNNNILGSVKDEIQGVKSPRTTVDYKPGPKEWEKQSFEIKLQAPGEDPEIKSVSGSVKGPFGINKDGDTYEITFRPDGSSIMSVDDEADAKELIDRIVKKDPEFFNVASSDELLKLNRKNDNVIGRVSRDLAKEKRDAKRKARTEAKEADKPRASGTVEKTTTKDNIKNLIKDKKFDAARTILNSYIVDNNLDEFSGEGAKLSDLIYTAEMDDRVKAELDKIENHPYIKSGEDKKAASNVAENIGFNPKSSFFEDVITAIRDNSRGHREALEIDVAKNRDIPETNAIELGDIYDELSKSSYKKDFLSSLVFHLRDIKNGKYSGFASKVRGLYSDQRIGKIDVAKINSVLSDAKDAVSILNTIKSKDLNGEARSILDSELSSAKDAILKLSDLLESKKEEKPRASGTVEKKSFEEQARQYNKIQKELGIAQEGEPTGKSFRLPQYYKDNMKDIRDKMERGEIKGDWLARMKKKLGPEKVKEIASGSQKGRDILSSYGFSQNIYSGKALQDSIIKKFKESEEKPRASGAVENKKAPVLKENASLSERKDWAKKVALTLPKEDLIAMGSGKAWDKNYSDRESILKKLNVTNEVVDNLELVHAASKELMDKEGIKKEIPKPYYLDNSIGKDLSDRDIRLWAEAVANSFSDEEIRFLTTRNDYLSSGEGDGEIVDEYKKDMIAKLGLSKRPDFLAGHVMDAAKDIALSRNLSRQDGVLPKDLSAKLDAENAKKPLYYTVSTTDHNNNEKSIGRKFPTKQDAAKFIQDTLKKDLVNRKHKSFTIKDNKHGAEHIIADSNHANSYDLRYNQDKKDKSLKHVKVRDLDAEQWEYTDRDHNDKKDFNIFTDNDVKEHPSYYHAKDNTKKLEDPQKRRLQEYIHEGIADIERDLKNYRIDPKDTKVRYGRLKDTIKNMKKDHPNVAHALMSAIQESEKSSKTLGKKPKLKEKKTSGVSRSPAKQNADRMIPNMTPEHKKLVSGILEALPKSEKFGDRKYFISSVWDSVKGETNMTREQFNKALVEMEQKGTIKLSRADLVTAMDPKLVANSKIQSGEGAQGERHFIVMDKATISAMNRALKSTKKSIEDFDLIKGDLMKSWVDKMKSEGGKHPFTWCVNLMKDHIGNPEGFCADVHKKAFGKTPMERKKDKK